MTMHMTMTEHVQRVKTTVASFPGILKAKYGDRVEYYDLSQTPPVARTLYAREIVSIKRDSKWHHPPAVAAYTPQELADIIAYLKFATTGSKQEIAASEIDPKW